MRVVVLMVAALVAAGAQVPSASAWTSRWNHAKGFKAIGHTELECDGVVQKPSCCVCQAVVSEIEKELNRTPDDYEMDVVFRISEEKKKIMYSRSEGRILDVLDTICEGVWIRFPDPTPKKQAVVTKACNSFVEKYEDELTKAFFNDFTSPTYRVCSGVVDVCAKPSPEDGDMSSERVEL